MKKMFVLATAIVMASGLSPVYAADIDKGKALFESPNLGGGATGKSCMTCHSGGEKLGNDLFEREDFTIMGMGKKNLAEVINVCIEKPLGGTAIDPQGQEMNDLIAYMKTLTAKPGK